MSPDTIKTPSELVNRPMKVYLAGPIQSVADGGVNWRREITPFLQSLGIEALDPTVYEAAELGNPTSVKDMINDSIKNEDWAEFDRVVDLLINRDIRLVHEADFVIAVVDPNAKSAGTISEIWESVEHANIPVYAVCPNPKLEWSYWLLRTVRRNGQVFESWSALKDYLTASVPK